ncbi:MAG: NAD(P)/FAD-dependent oxidoreductase [Deltaproteobacteria bacterium]|nr:NAD(P)/FAD-dependent oxidoreductase [Deltaproteobacteria bacterium]MBW2419823.1 NAD(P)/FAD-dependent oxidoreductase [Deltaproteobacteria bacterium]
MHESDYDVIIVGAGHNGLTAGVELVRSGYKVLVLEKTNWPGGQAATKELFPGFKHSVGAWALLIFREELIKYLEIDQHGFELIRPSSSFTVFGDEGDAPFIGYTDPIDLANHLVEDHGVEAMEAFNNLGSYFSVFKEMYDKYVDETPPPMEEIIAAAPDAETREALSKLCYGSAVEVMRKFFTEPGKFGTILGSLSASAIDGTHMGPFTKGSALSMSFHYCAGDTYDFKIPKGGIGTLSSSLQAVFEKYGGEVRFKAQVESFIVEDGAVTGVKMRDGDKLRANAIVSTLDAQSTFLRLCDRKQLPSDFVSSVEDIEYTNGYIQLHLTMKRLPTFTKQLEFVNGTEQSWLVAYIKSPEQLHRCWQQYQAGEVPDDPAVYCYFPSQLDPSLAPEGYHTCTIFSHYFPADIPKGKHNEMKELMVERVLGQIEKVVPDFRELIMDQVVFTQQYFEKTFGVTEGDFAMGLLHPGQMFGDRPVPGYADYLTPLANLYMAGGACHPGPGVTCLPGLGGARAVMSKLEPMSRPAASEVA